MVLPRQTMPAEEVSRSAGVGSGSARGSARVPATGTRSYGYHRYRRGGLETSGGCRGRLEATSVGRGEPRASMVAQAAPEIGVGIGCLGKRERESER